MKYKYKYIVRIRTFIDLEDDITGQLILVFSRPGSVWVCWSRNKVTVRKRLTSKILAEAADMFGSSFLKTSDFNIDSDVEYINPILSAIYGAEIRLVNCTTYKI